MNAPQPPKPRRRIAGEVKPADASAAPAPAPAESRTKLPKPKLPKREKTSVPPPPPPPSATADLPSAPPRPESAQVPRRRPSNQLIALIVLAVASVGFAGFGIWRGVDSWRSESIVDARAEATDAAASASEEIFSYEYTKLDAHMRDAQATMTPKFAKKFKAISPALNALAPQRQIQVKAVVRHAAAKECGEKCSPVKATVLIFIDQARITGDSDKPAVFGNRIEVFMVDREGKWLVDNIKAL
jgi:hypothetical protein